jgi:hypothetical protein
MLVVEPMQSPSDSGSATSKKRLRQSLIEKISGFKPALTGTLCDACNHVFGEGATVYVLATRYTRPDNREAWSLARTHCADCADSLVDDPEEPLGTEAVAKCELGPQVDSGTAAPLYNPDVVRVTLGPEDSPDAPDREMS